MLKRSEYKNTLSLILMIMISCITQIFTLMKSSVVAGHFGLSTEMDAYNFANSIVSFLFGLMAAGIPTIIIPGYVNREKRENVDSFITAIYGFLAIITVLVIILRFQIIDLFSNREEFFVNTACDVIIILLFSQYLMAITNITIAFFQCENKYNIPKAINLVAQIVVALFLVIYKNISIYQYAWIVSAGVIVNFIIDVVIAISCGWRFKPTFIFKNPDVKKMISMFLPILFSSSIYKLSLFIDSAIASRLDVGKLTALSYSNQISGMVNSVIVGNLLIYAYPKIIQRINKGAPQKEFWNQVNLFHSIVCLVIAGFISIGYEGVSLLFEHGSFDSNAVNLVYIGASIYIVGQQTNVVRDLIYRFFYANGDTKSASFNSLIVSIVNISVSIILVNTIGFFGIIIGTVVASIVSLIVILNRFRAKFGIEVPFGQLFKNYIVNVLICVLTIAVVLVSKKLLSFDRLVAILVYGIETIIVYGSLTLLFNRKVLHELMRL